MLLRKLTGIMKANFGFGVIILYSQPLSPFYFEMIQHMYVCMKQISLSASCIGCIALQPSFIWYMKSNLSLWISLCGV